MLGAAVPYIRFFDMSSDFSASSGTKRSNVPDAPFIITISGDLGSGKSVLAASLVEAWQADRYSTGIVQRRLAEKMGITTLELNKRAESDKSIDEQIDSVFRNLAKSAKNLVVDSRMAFHFLPQSFRIKLEVHPKVAALRIKGDTSRVGEGVYNTPEDIEAAIIARKASERERFKKYYDADIEDHAGYDLVINTTHVPTVDVNTIANTCIELWLKKQHFGKLWVSPKYLHCDVDPRTLQGGAEGPVGSPTPLPASQADGLVHVTKIGAHYVVTTGAEHVATALRRGDVLMAVTLTNAPAVMPSDQITKEWEKLFYYNHMEVI